MNAHEQLNLNIPEDVKQLMEKRGIRREDVENVIRHGETTGDKFIDPTNDRSLASLRPARVTYWVEYSVVGEGVYKVYAVYSHRMEMKRSGVS